MMKTTSESLRHHPAVAAVFHTAEGRFPNEEELSSLQAALPELRGRIDAARAIARVTDPVVVLVVRRLYDAYPFEQMIDLSVEKGHRDVSLVVKYAVLSMLAEDPDWFRDKVLVWMKTIVQSLRFPDLKPGAQRIFTDPASTAVIDNLQPYQRAIWENYALLRKEMKASLNAENFNAIEPYLDQTLNTLAND